MRRPTPLPANPAKRHAGAAASEGDPASRAQPRASDPPPPLRRPAQATSAAAPAGDASRAATGHAPAGIDAGPEPHSEGGAERRPRRGPETPGATGIESSTSDAPAAASAGEAGTVDAAEPPTRIRDVWRAARARRRVLRSEVRRFTVRARRRRIGWIVAGASTIALVATTLVIAYGPFFAVERIQIEGAVRLDAATLEEAVGAQLGRPLPLVDESEIKAALVQFPMVESYQIEARPPHDLLVRIVERTPIGVLEGPAGFSLVDAAGVVLETTPHPPAGAPLLRIAGGVDSPAFESAALVMRALPDGIRQQVTGVTASTRDDVTLLLGGANASVVWGSVSDSALKALVLETAMTRMPPAGVVSYDVSSPGAIVIR